MDRELGLNILSRIMGWTDEKSTEEFDWLRLIARLKYDDYREFLAGVRFFESLAYWLQQFQPEERETAYQFVRKNLVYVGPTEFRRLAERFYHHEVEERLLRTVSRKNGVPKYRVWVDPASRAEFERQKRKTLFMALSDGARIDAIRRANVGNLGNEQFVGFTQVDPEKWEDLLKELRKDLSDEQAVFSTVYLIDDFMGTGTSLLRHDEEKDEWKGKLVRFLNSIKKMKDKPCLDDDWTLCVHYYIAGYAAVESVKNREIAARDQHGENGWFNTVEFSFGTVLGSNFPIQADEAANRDFIALAKKYYNPSIEDRHTKVGGVSNIALGYGDCGFPLILEHNTPNNSIALLWAEAEPRTLDGVSYPGMRPLFRRRPRHS
jgi:hypothetical protein